MKVSDQIIIIDNLIEDLSYMNYVRALKSLGLLPADIQLAIFTIIALNDPEGIIRFLRVTKKLMEGSLTKWKITM